MSKVNVQHLKSSLYVMYFTRGEEIKVEGLELAEGARNITHEHKTEYPPSPHPSQPPLGHLVLMAIPTLAVSTARPIRELVDHTH